MLKLALFGFFLQLDVTDAAAVAAFPDALPEGWKEIDILVNNAGCVRIKRRHVTYAVLFLLLRMST